MFENIYWSGSRKNNDTVRNVVNRMLNHYDSAGDNLRIETCQWLLKDRERTSRKYNKHNDQYWMQEIVLYGRAEENVSVIRTENSGKQSQACDSNQANKRQKQREGRVRGKGKERGKKLG